VARPVSGQVYPYAADGAWPTAMEKLWRCPHAGQTAHCIRTAMATFRLRIAVWDLGGGVAYQHCTAVPADPLSGNGAPPCRGNPGRPANHEV
jgi:hypothetical protein